MAQTINLFMWGYQPHFRISFENRCKQVFELIGAQAEPKVLLVGVRKPNLPAGHLVCVEPEDGEWPVAIFHGLAQCIEDEIPNHELQQMFYTDEATMRDKPERIRKSTITNEIEKKISEDDRKHLRRSFCSYAQPVGDYYVVCVLQLPKKILDIYPTAKFKNWQKTTYETNLIHSCINILLEEGCRGLSQPEPGRFLLDDTMRSASEIVRKAAENLMHSPFSSDQPYATDLFDKIDLLSQLLYEGKASTGRIILSKADNPSIDFVLKLRSPVSLSKARWARKLLQMADKHIALIVENSTIIGLGKIINTNAMTFHIDFLGQHQWELKLGSNALLHTHFGKASLPAETIGKERFVDNMRRVFLEINEDSIHHFLWIFGLLTNQNHGSSFVIAEDAAEEANRLENQGTLISPTLVTEELINKASKIDGTVIVDTQGICHAIGTILDGKASPDSTPSRGARYNSAVRYVNQSTKPRMAFIISDDGTVDIVPLLRPQIERKQLDKFITMLSNATHETFHKARNFLDEHRFYLNEEQCKIVNASLERIEDELRKVGQIIFSTNRFTPHPEMNDSYFKD